MGGGQAVTALRHDGFRVREHVLDGGLISYGVDLRWCYHRAAYFALKIFRVVTPATCR